MLTLTAYNKATFELMEFEVNNNIKSVVDKDRFISNLLSVFPNTKLTVYENCVSTLIDDKLIQVIYYHKDEDVCKLISGVLFFEHQRVVGNVRFINTTRDNFVKTNKKEFTAKIYPNLDIEVFRDTEKRETHLVKNTDIYMKVYDEVSLRRL